MNETYTKLMMRQRLSEEANTAFYEKLENTAPRKKTKPALQAAVIAACICLLIPVTVFAVENIFGVVIANRVEWATDKGQPAIGVDIRFDNIKNHPITDFSEHLRTLDDALVVYYDSWEDAEADLGIELLSNSVCTDEKTARISCYYYMDKENSLREHCEGTYIGRDGQLYLAKISAAYQRNQVKFVVSAELTAEHPTITDAQLQGYHSTSIAYFLKYGPNATTEQYTTKNGIPVTICTVNFEDFSEYAAYFAVNDISYKICIVGCEGVWDDSAIYAVLCEVLEGFVL